MVNTAHAAEIAIADLMSTPYADDRKAPFLS